MLIAGFVRIGLLQADCRAVDYGCGDGKLSEFINAACGNQTGEHYLVYKYDKYMRPEGSSDYLDDADIVPGAFDFVVTCSVFEHLIGMGDVKKITSLVNDRGILATHTLVCEEIPDDSEWFYLLLGHCTFWTNASMGKLYRMNGFAGCAYHVEARMWFFFKDRKQYELLQDRHAEIPGTWVLSDDFVDYWKQKPYRK